MRKINKTNLEFKQDVVRKLLKHKITIKDAVQNLNCSRRTIYRYLETVTRFGLGALEDNRHSNNYKLTSKQLLEVIQKKKQGSWRSARKVLEITNIQNISNRRVQQIFVENGLNEVNVERLKPIVRFVAKEPNDLWQADIQGRMHFPYLGDAYLIANIDDCSRFILGAKWFSRQTQMNVFRVWYHCLFRWGLPKAMLSDKGSQYRSTNPKGQATYQYYAQALGIKLIFAHKARTKGKIERFWRFVQRDFVRENLKVRSFEELNKLFFAWQIKFNEEFKSDGLGMNKRTPASVYQPSEIRKPKQELQELLTITLRRYVYTDSTISLFGIKYKIPHGYIKCRIWLHLRGDKVSLESMGRIIYRFKLKV
ncbi:MAG: DDE-type integrase/transposase/recombinase [Candidatus Daviesbacteria bacterium]|nr:DDE-type integrase/transposase/recombinase [Candidatus Daviesbacteria bacterium]